MKKLIWLALILFFYGNIFGQGKIIEGDTSSFWHSRQQLIHEKLGLKDFRQSEDEFNFRFQNHGQIVEITKNGSEFSGVLANYVFREFGKKKIQEDTLYNYTALPLEVIETIYDLLQELDLYSLPSEEDIEDWSWGFDGITYIFEYANKTKYDYKTYWTPSIQDSLEEARIVLAFVEKLSKIIDLEQNRQAFEDTWPRSGCYNSGGLTSCFISNEISLGFLSSSRFPYGFQISNYISHLKKNTLNISAAFAYQKNNFNGTIIKSTINKSNIFIKRRRYHDFAGYKFISRNLRFLETQTDDSKAHLLYYGMSSTLAI